MWLPPAASRVGAVLVGASRFGAVLVAALRAGALRAGALRAGALRAVARCIWEQCWLARQALAGGRGDEAHCEHEQKTHGNVRGPGGGLRSSAAFFTRTSLVPGLPFSVLFLRSSPGKFGNLVRGRCNHRQQ